MRHALKKAGRIAAWGIGILVVLVGLILVLLQTPWAKDWLRGEITRRANAAIEGELAIGELSGNLLRTVTVRDIALDDGRGHPLATIDRAQVTYWLPSLLYGSLAIEEATLTEPRVAVRRYEDGTLNVSTLTKPSPEEPPSDPSEFGITIDRYALSDGVVVWEDQQTLAGGESDGDDGSGPSWSDLVDRAVAPPGDPGGPAPAEPLRNRLADQSPAPTETPGLVLVDAFGFEGSLELTLVPRIDNQLRNLDADIHTDTLAESRNLSMADVATEYGPARLSTEIGSLALKPGLEWTDASLHAALPTPEASATPESESAPEKAPPAIERFIADIGRLSVSETLLDTFVEGTDFRSDVTLEGRAGGTLTDLYARPTVSFSEGGTIDSAGTLDLAGDEPAYRAAVLGRKLEAAKLIAGEMPDTRFNIAARASGTGTDPEKLEANTAVAVWKSAIGSFDLQHLHARASADTGTFRLDTFEFDSSHLVAAAEGRYELGGDVALRADVQSRNGGLTAEQLDLKGLPPMGFGRADLDVALDGAIDPEADTVFGAVERATLRAGWDLHAVRLASTRLDDTDGRASVDVGAVENGNGARRLEVDTRATVVGFRSGARSLSRGMVDLEASGRLDDTVAGFEGLQSLSSQWSTRLVGARAGGARLGRLEADGRIATTEQARTFTTDVDADIRSVQSGDLSIDRLDADLGTGFRLAPSLASDDLVDRIDSEGELVVEKVTGPSFSVEHTRVELDVEGPPNDPVGTVGVASRDVRVAGREFATVELGVDARADRAVIVNLSASPTDDPDRPYLAGLSTTYSAAFDRFGIDTLFFGRPDQRWRLADPTTIELLDGAVTVDQLRLENEQQSLFVDGTYRTVGAQDLEVRVENFAIGRAQELGDLRPVEDLDGTVDLTLSLEGTSRRPNLDLSLSVRELSARGYGPFALELGVESDGSRVQITDMTTSLADHTVATATAGLPLRWSLEGDTSLDTKAPITADLDVKQTSLDQVSAILPPEAAIDVQGGLVGSFRLTGTLDEPSVDADFDIDNVAAAGELGGTTVDLENIASSVVLHYGPQNESDTYIDFQVDTTWRNRRVFGIALASDAHLVEWGRGYSDGRLTLEELTNKLLRAPLTFSFELDEMDFTNLPLEILRQADAEGTLSGKLAVEGPLIRPTAQAELDVNEFGWNQYRDIFLDLDANLADKILKLDQFRIEWDSDEILAAEGKVPVPIQAVIEGRSLENLPVDFALQLRPLPLAKLSAVDYSFTQIQGTMSGFLRVQGNLRAPKIDARFAVADVLFSEDHTSTFATWLNAGPRRVDGGLLACRDDQPMLTGEYSLPVNLDLVAMATGVSPLAEGEIRASLQGENLPIAQLVPMPLLKEWIDDPDGYLHVDLDVRGTWDQLDPSGSLAIEEGGITIVPYGRRYEDIELATTIESDEIVLKTFHVEEGEGVVEASGSAQMSGLAPTSYNFDVETKNFNIGGLATEMPAIVTAKADIEGNEAKGTQQIDVHLTDLTVELPESDEDGTHPTALSEDIVFLETADGAQKTEIAEYLTGSATGGGVTEIQVDVKIDRDSFVRHPNGYLNFSADIGVQIKGARTILSGQVNSVRGEFEFLGRKFEVPKREAIVQFTGAAPPNPRLDISAAHPLPRSVVAELEPPIPQNPAIYVRVRGSATKPRLELTSEPTFSDSDIVFILVTGRAPDTAGTGEQQGVASQAAAAGGGILAGLLQQKLSATLPVDVLRFEAGESGLAGSRLRVGRYFGSKWFVSAAIQPGLGGEGFGYEFLVEYHFLPRWLLEASYGDDQTGEFNVFWDVH